LGVEVTNVSKHGFWLLIEGQEIFLSFKDFPWFRDANIRELLNVTMPHSHHLHWPDIDVDLALESLEHPERYPLISSERRERYNQRMQRTRTARR
jgi:hypothetical protein